MSNSYRRSKFQALNVKKKKRKSQINYWEVEPGLNDEKACGSPLGSGGQEWVGRKGHWKEAEEGFERSGYWMGLLSTCTLKMSRMMAGLEVTERL